MTCDLFCLAANSFPDTSSCDTKGVHSGWKSAVSQERLQGVVLTLSGRSCCSESGAPAFQISMPLLSQMDRVRNSVGVWRRTMIEIYHLHCPQSCLFSSPCPASHTTIGAVSLYLSYWLLTVMMNTRHLSSPDGDIAVELVVLWQKKFTVTWSDGYVSHLYAYRTVESNMQTLLILICTISLVISTVTMCKFSLQSSLHGYTSNNNGTI